MYIWLHLTDRHTNVFVLHFIFMTDGIEPGTFSILEQIYWYVLINISEHV